MCVCFCIYRIFPCGANGQVIFCWCSWRVTEITRVHWHHENIDAFKYIFTCINISSICSQLTPIIEMAQLLTLQFFAIWFHLQAAKVDWRWWTMALQRRIALKSLPNSESNWWKTSRIGFEKMYFKKKRNFWISDMDGVRIFVFGNFTWLFRSSGTWTIFQAQDLKIAGRMCWQRCRYNGAGPVTSWEWLLGSIDIRNHDDITHKICTGSCYIYIYISIFRLVSK